MFRSIEHHCCSNTGIGELWRVQSALRVEHSCDGLIRCTNPACDRWQDPLHSCPATATATTMSTQQCVPLSPITRPDPSSSQQQSNNNSRFQRTSGKDFVKNQVCGSDWVCVATCGEESVGRWVGVYVCICASLHVAHLRWRKPRLNTLH